MILVHRRLWIVTVEYICSTCTFLWQWWRQINIWTSPSDKYLSMWDVRTTGRATTAEVSIQHSKSITVISWAVHRLTLVRWLMIPQKYFYLDARCCQFLIFLWRRHWIVAIIVWSCAEIRHMQISNKTQVEPRASFHLNIDGWMSSYCQDAFNYWISCSEIDMVFVFAIH